MRKTNSNITLRSSFLRRETKETSIYASIDLDGQGLYEIDTGINFLDHMLEQFTKNSNVNLYLKATGDLNIDLHHTIEDTAIVLGQLISDSLADRESINRYSSQTIVMDESSAKVDIDLCSRTNLNLKIPKLNNFVGDFPTEMINHFFDTFVKNAKFTCHLKTKGKKTHHIVESTFKSFAKAFGEAIKLNSSGSSSTKGFL